MRSAAGARATCCAKTGTTDAASALRASCATATSSRSSRTGARSRRTGRRAGPAQDRFAQVLARRRRRLASAGRPRRGARHARLLRLRQLRPPGLLADDSAGRLLRDEFVTLAPSASSAAFASLAGEALERAGDHVGLPVSGPSIGLSSSPTSKRRPSSRSSCDERPVLLVREPLGDRSRRGRGRYPSTSSISSWVASSSRSTSEVAREACAQSPSRRRDVQPEEDARERHAASTSCDRVDRVRRGDLARSRRARAAAPSSGGRDRASSGRAPRPRAAERTARRRPRCRPRPSTQLISVSRPREGRRGSGSGA